MQPKVSICIPAYNQGKYLGEALASALEQSFADTEIVVSDNQSTDDTARVAMAFAKQDPRVRYVTTESHVGMHENFNRCVKLARGSYIKFLCADDVLDARCVERLLQVIESDPRIRLAACARQMFRDGGTRNAVRGYARRAVLCAGEDAIRTCYFRGNRIGEPTAVLLHRDDALGGFSARFVQIVDMEMWFRILEGGWFAYVPEPLCGIRVHEEQATRGNISSGAVTADREKLYAEFAGKPYLKGTILERMLWDFRMAFALARERTAGRPARRSTAVYFPQLAVPVAAAGSAFWHLRRLA